MKIIKILLLSVFLLFNLDTVCFSNLWNENIKNWIIPISDTITGHIDWNWDFEANDLLLYFKKAIFSLFYIIAVWVFIFLWIKLAMARGNAEEFKKALMGFVYAIVGIVLVPLAYVLVSLVSWINF